MADEPSNEATTAPTNGHVDTTPAKRKHDSEPTPYSINMAPAPTKEQQQDLLEVLRGHQQAASFLDHEFQEQSNEPKPKRAKLSSASKATTLAQKLSDARYTEWKSIISDTEAIKDKVIESVRSKEIEPDDRPSIAELKQKQQANSTAALITSIVTAEATARPVEADAVKQEPEEQANGVTAKAEIPPPAGTILTLFGNAPTPKQLFSSLQSGLGAQQTPVIKTELNIEELSLPNGLSATKIRAPAQPVTQKAPTFADTFPAPFALPALAPPKVNKKSLSNNSVLKWELKDALGKGSKRGGYTTQKLVVADWLSYGGDSRQDSLSPQQKRQQRDRALSSSRSDAANIKEDLAADLEKQEEALFQRAYSSFAPSHDNSRALVDASTKSMVWWNKSGSRQFDDRFAGQYGLGASSLPGSTAIANKPDDDFAAAVEAYTEDADGPVEVALDLTDVDAVLRRITDLLQTLASYQWIRASVPVSTTAARPAISTTPVISGKAGEPNQPSDEEREIYEKLQHEIAYLVLQLPPYAMAKIDGEQLADLGVSAVLEYTNPNYRGQLEEDQVARLSRYTAAATAASVASLTRSSATNNPHYSSSSRNPAIGQSANTRYGQSPSYTPARSNWAGSQQQPGSVRHLIPPVPSNYSQPGQYARSGAAQQTPQPPKRDLSSSIYASYSKDSQQRPSYQAPFQQKSQTAAVNAVAYQNQGYGTPMKTTGQQFAQQLQQTGSERASPVNGLQQARAPPPPIVPRSPQPPAQMQVNGHA